MAVRLSAVLLDMIHPVHRPASYWLLSIRWQVKTFLVALGVIAGIQFALPFLAPRRLALFSLMPGIVVLLPPIVFFVIGSTIMVLPMVAMFVTPAGQVLLLAMARILVATAVAAMLACNRRDGKEW